jgi:hypothetical protein
VLVDGQIMHAEPIRLTPAKGARPPRLVHPGDECRACLSKRSVE